jgi:hypothetical protein
MILAEVHKHDIVQLPTSDWVALDHLVLFVEDGAVTTSVLVEGQASNERYTFPDDTPCIYVGRHLAN